MKTKKLLFIAAAGLIVLGFTSCKKTDDTSSSEIETTFELSTDQAVSENLTEDANDIFMEAAENLGLMGSREPLVSMNLTSCAVVTVTPASGFPKTIVMDFGTGCTPPGGSIERRGIIRVVISDSVRRPGSTAVMTFDNFYVNNYKKEGTITWTNTSTPGTRSWERKVENGKITAPDGRYWLHTSLKNITQVAGVNTPRILLDDEFSITGNATVTNAAGRTRTAAILQALHKQVTCENIDRGTIRFEGPAHFSVLDFGNGTCDRIATISIDGRPPRTILLR